MPSESEIFLAARKLDAYQRAAYLQQACGDNATLRRDVEDLLAADATPDRTGAYVPQRAAGFIPVVGDIFAGRYKLREKLGEGGMGTVYVADQLEPVQRRVALKVLKTGLGSVSALARFEQERQALALMDHPNIAKVFDAGTVGQASSLPDVAGQAGGLPYFVMELIKGVPITKYCDDAKLTPRQRLELFIPVCQAVQHAHQKGIIHRDLKPSNVLIGLYDGHPVSKVIDFGVAKATGPRLTEESIYTEVGSLIGTLEYMSPEQAELNNLDIDTRADVYALGVVLYELLTGSVPFSRKEMEKAGFAEMLRVIKEVEPPKPSTKLSGSGTLPSIAAMRHVEPKKLTALVRGELDWIVMKCLEKERGRRYESANGLAMDVQRYLADEPVVAGPPSAGYRLRKFVRRNKGQVIAASLVLLALIGGMIGTSWGLYRADEQRQLAEAGEKLAGDRLVQVEAEKQKAEEEKRIAQAVRDFLQHKLLGQADSRMQADALLRAGGLAAEAKENPTIRELLDRAAKELAEDKIEANFPKQPLLQAEILKTAGDTYHGVGEYQRAIELLERCATLLKQNIGADHPNTIATLNNLAGSYLLAARLTEAIALFEQVRDVQLKKYGADHPDTLATLSNLTVAYQDAGKLAEAIALFEQVRDAFVKKHGADHPDTLTTMANLAWAYQNAGKLTEAIALFEQVRDAFVKKHGADHPDTLATLNNLAEAYSNAGKLNHAIALFEQVRDACEKKLGGDHPSTLTTLNNLAAAYLKVRKLSEAITLLEQVRDARVKKLEADHPDTFNTLGHLAAAYWRTKHFDKSVLLFENVLKRWETALGRQHQETQLLVANLGVNYKDAGRLTEAIPLLEEAYRASRKFPIVRWVETQLLDGYVKAGQSAEAVRLVQELLADAREELPKESPQLAGALAQYSRTLLQLKAYTDAEPLLRECLAIREKQEPDDWRTFNTKTMLGEALLGQMKYADARALLVQGYEGMKERETKMPKETKVRLTEALERLVPLYDAWGKPVEAERWRLRLEEAKGDVRPMP